MAIESHCSGCGALLRVDDVHAGQAARCPQCGRVYTVPASTADSDSGPTAAPSFGVVPQAELASQWRLQTPEGQIYGPVDRRTLDRWLREGRIAADYRLQSSPDTDWQAADQVFPQLASGGRSGNPFADAGRGAGVRPGFEPEPHRGGLILGLGLAGLLVTCPLLSLLAWILGNHDLRKMREGRMDPSGMGLTEAGRIIGMLLTLLWILIFAVAVFVSVVVIVAHA